MKEYPPVPTKEETLEAKVQLEQLESFLESADNKELVEVNLKRCIDILEFQEDIWFG